MKITELYAPGCKFWYQIILLFLVDIVHMEYIKDLKSNCSVIPINVYSYILNKWKMKIAHHDHI